MNKLLILTVFILIFGLYVGVGRIDPGICNGPYRQKALHISVTKPILAGYWDIWFAFGNKHWDYKKEKTESRHMECKDLETGDIFMSHKKDNEHFNMDCVWVREERIQESGCTHWYDNDYHIYARDLVIDLVPFLKPVKD